MHLVKLIMKLQCLRLKGTLYKYENQKIDINNIIFRSVSQFVLWLEKCQKKAKNKL